MAAYGDRGSAHDYEYDHLVSLELGGADNDARNLWPEPGASPNPKDAIENALHRMVCDGQVRLAEAQRIIATSSDYEAAGSPARSACACAIHSRFSARHCSSVRRSFQYPVADSDSAARPRSSTR